MAKAAKDVFDVQCPCCHSTLRVDAETHAVLSHKEPERPKTIEDLAAEVEKLKGASSRREELFQKSFAAEKQHGKVLEKKFEELFKQVKEDPNAGTPLKRDFDLD
jgi:hypothetical protein